MKKESPSRNEMKVESVHLLPVSIGFLELWVSEWSKPGVTGLEILIVD